MTPRSVSKGIRGRAAAFCLGLLPLLALALAGCSQGAAAPATPSSEQALPAFAYTSSESLMGYRAALRYPELLSKIPCYCGCKELKGRPSHRNTKECFIKPDGSFDDHAANCDLCSKIAIDAVRWHEAGISDKDVRAQIDAKYSPYGTPTDTPPVP